MNHIKSEEYVKKFDEQVNKTTWDLGLPKYYLKDGWLVEHYKNGEIIKLKKI